MRKLITSITTLLCVAVLASTAIAAVTFDPATGIGFVGKGDVQLVYGWNNKALQDNASSVQFRTTSSLETEVSWDCTNTNNSHVAVQVRERTTTVSVQGLVTTVMRERNQITGFDLTGYRGAPSTSSTTDGPGLNTCPHFWTLTRPAGDPVVVSNATAMQVSTDGSTWFAVGS